ncbi:hypothetical protein QQZ08_008551 [Neonectria magnoliae]|uniref:DUF3883 domain-containing protein n=1 Tax=Neonectria magnoliae TaxID=2732573 RepID=A0ABR1HVE8_9HYPO
MTMELKSIPVLCQDGSMIALEKTYLPFQDLQDECARYLRGEANFPFLELTTVVERGSYARDWPFLVPHFGVGIDADIDFHKQPLLQIRFTRANEVESEHRLTSIYSNIYGKYVQSEAMEMIKTRIRKCLWDAPPTFTTSHPLRSRFETSFAHQSDARQVTERLFRDVLEIPDCSWYDILNELNYASENGYDYPEAIPELYVRLYRMRGLTRENEVEIKASFETQALIYAEGTWLRVSECLWSSEINIQGKTALVDEYENLQEFLIDFLGVDTLNLQIVYDELTHLGRSSSASVAQIKQQMQSLNGLLSDVKSYPNVKPEPLRKARIFPVNIPGGEVELCTGETTFAIVDRVLLGEYFAGRVKTLDFDLHEYFLPLRQSKTDKDISGMSIRDAEEYGKDFSQVSSRNDLHLCEEGMQLEIFVPRKKKRRQFCYASKLPARLFEWLMTDPTTQITAGTSEKAYRLVATVLNASKYVVPEILEENGIVSIGIESEDHEEEDGVTDDSSESEAAESLRGSLTRDNGAELAIPIADVASETLSPADATSMSLPLQTTTTEAPYVSATALDAASRSQSAQLMFVSQNALGNRPYTDPDVRLSAINEDAEKYQQLLGRVILAARRADFPTPPNSVLGMSTLLGALPTDYETESSFEESIRFRSKTQLERDKMIGAAGELYVFELLKSLDPSIPDFSMENWQSTIRDYVKVHAEYSYITRWPGNRETADIVYADTTGALTKVLIDHDYLHVSWEDARPNYLLEVKTTTGPCKTPFFMSRRQYERK